MHHLQHVQELGWRHLRREAVDNTAFLPRADPFAIQGLAARWLRAFALPPPLSLSLRVGPALCLACTAHCEILPPFSGLQPCVACPCHGAVMPPPAQEPNNGASGMFI